MDKSPDFLHLSQIQLFQGLSNDELGEVIRNSRLRQVVSGEYYFYQGDPATAVFVLREGRIKLTQVGQDGQQILLRVLTPWALFAIIGITGNRAYPVSSLAAEDGSAFVWRSKDMIRLIQNYPRLAMNAMQLLSDYVQEFQDRLREIATERVERRLARSLVRLANQSGKKNEEGVVVDLHLSRQDLAEMVGTTLYTVSRIMSAWEDAGIITSGRERVVIRNAHRLILIAEDIPSL